MQKNVDQNPFAIAIPAKYQNINIMVPIKDIKYLIYSSIQ